MVERGKKAFAWLADTSDLIGWISEKRKRHTDNVDVITHTIKSSIHVIQPRVYFGAVIDKNSVIGKQSEITFASGITKATDTPQPFVMIS